MKPDYTNIMLDFVPQSNLQNSFQPLTFNFSYDQMTLLGIEVHSDELEVLQQAADTYDWKAMGKKVEPKFKESALDFRDREQD